MTDTAPTARSWPRRGAALVRRTEPFVLVAISAFTLLHWSDVPWWDRAASTTALAWGLVSAWRPMGAPMAIGRGLAAVALLVGASHDLPDDRTMFLPWLTVIALGYPLLLGVRRSAVVLVAVLAVYPLVAPDFLDRSDITVRIAMLILGGVIAGLFSQAVVDATAAEEQASRDAEEARVSTRRLEAVINAAPVGIVMVDRDYRVRTNRQADDYLFDDFRPTRAGLERPVHPDDRAEIEHLVHSVLQGNRRQATIRTRRPSGDYTLTEVTAAPIFSDERGDLIDSVVILRDVQAEADAETALQRFKMIADSTSDIIGIGSVTSDASYLNPAGQRFFGVSGSSFAELFGFVSEVDRDRLIAEAVPAVEAGHTWTGEVELVDSQHRKRSMSAVVIGVRNAAGELTAFAVTYRDLAERKQLEARLAHEAHHDTLTGLPNRHALLHRLDELIATGEDIAVLFCDLDGFKIVNDSLGHVVGDRVLQVVAERLRCSAREDDIVGRLAGDEFLIICRNVAAVEEVVAVAQRMLGVVGAPIRLNDRDHVVTLSVGVALARDAVDAGDLLQRADLAMYHSKQSGRGKVSLFDEEMRIRANERLNVERELRVALDGGQLDVLYQPIVSLPDRQPIGFEALVRWRHPTRGLLSPDQFLQVAEDTGMTVQLGELVLSHACAAAAALRLQSPNLSMSINLSAVQLADERLVDHVALAVTRAGIVASAITIEITEEIAMNQLEAAESKLDELRSLGVRLAIDDFGTGYSNLALLRNLSADFVKIDRSLISGLGVRPADAQVVRMILSLTQELGFAPIAEGVAEEVQLQALLELNCRVAQGHLFAAPMTLLEAFSYVSSRQPTGSGTGTA